MISILNLVRVRGVRARERPALELEHTNHGSFLELENVQYLLEFIKLEHAFRSRISTAVHAARGSWHRRALTLEQGVKEFPNPRP